MAQEGGVAYLFDENTSPNLVKILNRLGDRRVKHIGDVFGRGHPDLLWIPIAAERDFTYVTMDHRQMRDAAEAAVISSAGARALFLPLVLATRDRWDQALWFLRFWRGVRVQADALAPGEVRFVDLRGRLSAQPPRRRQK